MASLLLSVTCGLVLVGGLLWAYRADYQDAQRKERKERKEQPPDSER